MATEQEKMSDTHDEHCERIEVDIGVGEMHSPCGCKERTYERRISQLERENAVLRLLENVSILEGAAIGTFLKGGDIPSTIEGARGALVKRALKAERENAVLQDKTIEKCAKVCDDAALFDAPKTLAATIRALKKAKARSA